jgi:hypothetical protein
MDRLLRASVVVRAAGFVEESTVVQVEIENRSDARYVLRNLGGVTFHRSTDMVSLEPRGVTTLLVKGALSPSAGRAERVPKREALGVGPQRIDQRFPAQGSLELEFEVLNALVAPRKHPRLRVAVKVDWN